MSASDRGPDRSKREQLVADQPWRSGVHKIDAVPSASGDVPRFLRVFRFGEFIADERLFQLRRLAEPVPVQPKVLELIFYLLRHRDRVVTKAELFASLWSGVVVTGASLLYAVKEARKVLGDDAQDPRFVRNVRGRGYRFIAPVEEGTGPLLRRKEIASREPAAHALSGRRPSAAFVGREELMSRLRAYLRDALGEHATALMISGDPGIGKSRAAEELASLARTQGVCVLSGRGEEVEGAPPFWPWVQVIRAYLAQHELKIVKQVMGARAVDIAAIAPELRELWPDLGAATPIADAQGRFRVFDALTVFLRNAAAHEPLLVVLDDVHCADAPSLLLLKHLFSQLGQQRLLVLTTARSAAAAHNEALVQVASEITRRDPARYIELHGLLPGEIARLVHEITGRSASDAVVQRLSELTAGNPLFLTQVLHMLSAEGRLGQLEGAADSGDALPVGLLDGLSRYLDFLAEPVRRVLGIASVFGREVSAAPLAAVSGMGYELILECLGEAVRWRVLGDPPEVEGPYRFVHVLLRDVFYARLSVGERVRLHREVGEALLAHYQGAAEPPLAQVAHHFLEAAGPQSAERAVHYALLAARSASERAAYEDAAALCQRGLRVIEIHGEPLHEKPALVDLLIEMNRRLGR